jgi:hypothetical protein
MLVSGALAPQLCLVGALAANVGQSARFSTQDTHAVQQFIQGLPRGCHSWMCYWHRTNCIWLRSALVLPQRFVRSVQQNHCGPLI